MSDKTGIEWTDATWNPVTGCTKVSPGCDHCYAETFAERWRGTPGHHFEAGFDLTLRPERLDQPLRWTKPRRIFVNSMSDLFHKDIPDAFIAQVFGVMAAAQQHTFQVLTKRHGRMRSLLNDEDFRAQVTQEIVGLEIELGRQFTQPDDFSDWWPLRNVWLGVSVEDQQRADLRIPALLETPAAVRFLSCEPLLGPVNLDPWRNPGDLPNPRRPADTRLGWVIAGGESGPGARPMHPDWVRALRDQCEAARVPFLFKQWGQWGLLPKDARTTRHIIVADDGTVYQSADLLWPDGPRYGEAMRAGHDKAHLHFMYDAGKTFAGRELDGRTWDEYPAVAA